ncbi:MAG TPA: S-methyl-5-thioribose-1-phosphate isomerase [Alphaproteobacteria bacterium]|nr:S-methyl-5-thioribose-1-phosphate isomerase [Alphaproteobacteria bacterium]
MKIDGRPYRTIWLAADGRSVEVIDQTKLPHAFETQRWETVADAADGIRAMVVRGAPLIGAAGAYGMALAANADPSDDALVEAYSLLLATRPTAVNLAWGLDRVTREIATIPPAERAAAAYQSAAEIADEDVATCRAIGEYGSRLISDTYDLIGRDRPINVLTHCNAGWLATVDWGTALAPVYVAHDAGIPVHVWVDETRPRNQGASLTAWELSHHGVPHTVIADNVGGHLMQHGMVDLCLVGSDRTTAAGDVCNKIGTYLKALAADDNEVPFYACVPSSTIDWTLSDGVKEIPIEQRDGREVSEISGMTADGTMATVRVTPTGSPVANYAFDVTPSRYVTGIVTERGIAHATRAGLGRLFPEFA